MKKNQNKKIKKMKTIKYKNMELVVYVSDAMCGKSIDLIDVKGLKKFCYINITDQQKKQKSKKDYFWLKDYSESKEIVEFLLKNKYLKKTKNVSYCQEVKMLKKFKDCICSKKYMDKLKEKMNDRVCEEFATNINSISDTWKKRREKIEKETKEIHENYIKGKKKLDAIWRERNDFKIKHFFVWAIICYICFFIYLYFFNIDWLSTVFGMLLMFICEMLFSSLRHREYMKKHDDFRKECEKEQKEVEQLIKKDA